MVAVDNLSTSTMSDETWRGIIIRSIPPTPKWLPVIPSLYSMATSADIVSTLLAHGMILGRESKTTITTNSSTTALAAHTNEGCKNPDCKAKDRSTHTTDNCYWPGGGKEGQFPANFGQRSKANITISSPSSQTEHFVLLACTPETPGQSGVLIDEPDISSVGEQTPTPLDTNVFIHVSTITDHAQDTESNLTTALHDRTLPTNTPFGNTETDTTNIIDNPINNQPAGANQPDTTDITTLHHNPDHHQDTPLDTNDIIQHDYSITTVTNCTQDTGYNPTTTLPTPGTTFINPLLAETKPDIPDITVPINDPGINDVHHANQVLVVTVDQRDISVQEHIRLTGKDSSTINCKCSSMSRYDNHHFTPCAGITDNGDMNVKAFNITTEISQSYRHAITTTEPINDKNHPNSHLFTEPTDNNNLDNPMTKNASGAGNHKAQDINGNHHGDTDQTTFDYQQFESTPAFPKNDINYF